MKKKMKEERERKGEENEIYQLINISGSRC